jgi:predicted ArsR family transcriptional regulator
MPASKQVSDEEIIAVFRETSDPAMYASEIGNVIGYTSEGARKRLDELVERGELQRKKSGKRSVVYWLDESDDV